MANVPIVTSLTLAELEILVAANGLNPGLQYKITDKNWLLLATSNNSLTPVNGILTIDTPNVPEFILADIVLVDSGLITSDISSETGDPFTLVINPGSLIYIPTNVYVKADCIVPLTNLKIYANMTLEGEIASITGTVSCQITGKLMGGIIPNVVSIVVVATGNDPLNGNGIRMIAEYKRLKYL